MPRACTVKGMLLKCVKSWLYSCSFNVHKKSWNPSVKLACGAWTSCSLSGTNIWHICACLPFVRFLSWSLWSPSWNIDVRRLFFFFFLYIEGGLTFSGLSVRRRSVLRLWQISSVDPTFVLVCQPAGVSVSFFCFCSDLYLSLSLSTLSQPDSFSLLFIFCSFEDALFHTAAEISALHYFLLDNLLNKIRTRV